MRVHLSADATRLSISLSRPWLQGWIGGMCAAAGAFFLILLMREDLSTGVDGVQVPAFPAATWGVGLLCIFFIALGLVIASHRRGTILDRESGLLIR